MYGRNISVGQQILHKQQQYKLLSWTMTIRLHRGVPPDGMESVGVWHAALFQLKGISTWTELKMSMDSPVTKEPQLQPLEQPDDIT